MEASQEGHLELVRYLLEARADVNATTGIIYRATESTFSILLSVADPGNLSILIQKNGF
jgi:hypothetical protein